MGLSTCWAGTSYDKSACSCDIANDEVPDRFMRGIEAVQKAPTARNSQPFVFKWKNNAASVRACKDEKRVMIDVGIAKLHFEIGANGGSWAWGNGAQYTRIYRKYAK